MAPLIDTELERVDRKHAQLTQLSKELVDAINLYHTLMRESDRPMAHPMFNAYMNQPSNMYGMYQPMPNMYGGPVGFPPRSMAGPGSLPPGPPHMTSIGPLPGQQPIGQIPPQFQNGHMPLAATQLPPQSQQQQQQQINPGSLPIDQNIHPPNPNHPPLNSNTHGAPSNLPMLPNQMQQMMGHMPISTPNVAQEYQHHHPPPINTLPNHHLQQQQQPHQNSIPQQNIAITQQQHQPSQQTNIPQTHVIQHMSGASPVHLASQHSTNNTTMYASIPNNIIQPGDSKMSIPVYQQR